MSPDPTRAGLLFLAALELPDAARPAFLAAACGVDHALREEVEALLRAHSTAPLETPVGGRGASRLTRVFLWIRRRAAVVGLVAAVGAAVTLAVVAGTIASDRAVVEVARAEAERSLADLHDSNRRTVDSLTAAREKLRATETEREKLAVVEYGRAVQIAHRAWRENDPAGTRRLLDVTRPDLRGWEWHHVRRLLNPAPVATPSGWRPALGHASAYWSPDGTRFVAVSEKRVAIFDAATGRELVALDGETGSRHRLIAFGPDGSRLLTHGTGPARLWDAVTGKLVSILPGADVLSWSRGGSRVLGINHRTARELEALQRAQRVVLAVFGFASEAAKIDSPLARRWDARTGAELPTHFPADLRAGWPEGSNRSALWHPDGARLAVVTGGSLFGCRWTQVRVLDAESGAEVLRLAGGWDVQGVVAWSPDGSRLVTCTGPRDSRDYWLWDATTGAQLPLRQRLNETDREYLGQPTEPLVQFSADGTRMVFTLSRYSFSTQVWDPDGREEIPTAAETAFPADVRSIVRSPRGDLAFVYYHDGSRRLIDPKTGEVPPSWEGVALPPGAVWSPDGNWLTFVPTVTGPGGNATAGPTVRVWDVATARETELRGHTGVTILVWGPDGRRLVTGASDRTVRVWDVRSGESVALKEYPGGLGRVDWSPDGRRLLTVAGDGTARLWDARTGAELAVFRTRQDRSSGSPGVRTASESC